MYRKKFPRNEATVSLQKHLIDDLPNIYLVGLMGSGKSTVGRHLSKSLGRAFLDSDEEIVKRTGASIPTIFELEGEEGFRQREEQMILDLSKQRNVIIATGGGAIIRELNREQFSKTGIVIYLHATPERLHVRTSHDRNRPLLQTADPLATLQALYAIRHPLYLSVANIVVKSGTGQVNQVLNAILLRLIDLAKKKKIPQIDKPAQPAM